jgi:hypothetical protein
MKLGFYSACATMVMLSAGCASQTDTTGSQAATGAMTGSGGSVPSAVGATADSLKLGAFQDSDGAAGTLSYNFAKGSIRVNSLNRINSIYIQNGNVTFTGRAVDAIVQLGVGAFVSQDAGAGSLYDVFDNATLQVSAQDQSLVSVKFSDGRRLDGDALLTGLALELGSFKDQNGAAGTLGYTFAGGVVLVNDQTQKVHDVKVPDSSGQTVDLVDAVVEANVANALGRFVSEDNGAGHAYFHFAFGTVDYSNVSNSVVDIKH